MAEPKTISEAFALGVAEADQDLTWADSNRSDDNGHYTDLDEAYDNGRYSVLDTPA